MFESRSEPANDPFILWLTGGPGCSGQLALLNENGPCHVTKDSSTGTLSTVNNPHSWTNKATVLWIDQPTGVGFSYGDKGDYDQDEAGIRDDMYHFLLEFFAAHPEYAKLPFYVFGESYGGHFAPNVAYRVWEGNSNASKSGDGAAVINLQGLAVGNGLTDPAIQYQYYAQMAYNNTYGVASISKAQYSSMVAETPKCIAMINKCQTDITECPTAQDECNTAQMGPYEESGPYPFLLGARSKGCSSYLPVLSPLTVDVSMHANIPLHHHHQHHHHHHHNSSSHPQDSTRTTSGSSVRSQDSATTFQTPLHG
jgi:cathepsin A (carboxypeptidase C)